jgi:hypothetical protein
VILQIVFINAGWANHLLSNIISNTSRDTYVAAFFSGCAVDQRKRDDVWLRRTSRVERSLDLVSWSSLSPYSQSG